MYLNVCVQGWRRRMRRRVKTVIGLAGDFGRNRLDDGKKYINEFSSYDSYYHFISFTNRTSISSSFSGISIETSFAVSSGSHHQHIHHRLRAYSSNHSYLSTATVLPNDDIHPSNLISFHQHRLSLSPTETISSNSERVCLILLTNSSFRFWDSGELTYYKPQLSISITSAARYYVCMYAKKTAKSKEKSCWSAILLYSFSSPQHYHLLLFSFLPVPSFFSFFIIFYLIFLSPSLLFVHILTIHLYRE